MPFITEEIYQEHYKKHEKEKSIHVSSWPDSKLSQKSLDSLYKLDLFESVISDVRQEKSKSKKSIKSEIILTIEKGDIENLEDMLKDLKNVTNAKEIKEGKFKVEFVEGEKK